MSLSHNEFDKVRTRPREPDAVLVSGPPECRYVAFISYRHVEADRKWALWLHTALESYRIPKPLSGAGLPSRLGRVFRDEEELSASADLSQELNSSLKDSRFLIVICSLSTPASEWVNAEVKAFRALGRGDHILALLVEGDPQTAFPPALCEIREDVFESQQPLAADVRPNTIESKRALRHRALLRLVATIVGLRFDDLRQREHERRIRRAWAAGALFAALTVLLSLATIVTYRARVSEKAQRLQAIERLADLYGQNALVSLDGNDFSGALLWLAAAVETSPRAGHRWRMLFSETRRATPSLVTAVAQPTAIESFATAATVCRFATGDRDGFLRIRTGTGGVIPVRVSERGTVNDVRFSRDGNRIVTAASDGTARVWDATTGRASSAPLLAGGIVHWASISGNLNTIVTVASFVDRPNYELRLWRPDGTPVGSIQSLGPSIKSISFYEKSGDFLVIIGDAKGWVRVYDTRQGLLTTAAVRHHGAVEAVAVDDSGRYMASASEDETARVWDVRTGRAVTPPLRHDDQVTSIAFDPTGTRVVTGSWDHTARVWSVADGRALAAPMTSNDGVLSVAFDSAATRVATGAFGGIARVWDAATGEPLTVPLQHDDDVDGVSLGQSMLVTRSGREVRLWRLDSTNPRPLLLNHGKAVNDVELCPDGSRVATASSDHTARVWDARTGEPVTPPLRHIAAVLNTTFSSDGLCILTTDDAGNVRAWDATKGSPLGPWLRHRLWAQYAQFATNGISVITAGGDDAVHVWDYVSGSERVTPIRQEDMITGLAMSVDGDVAVTTLAKSMRLWNTVTGQATSRRLQLRSITRQLAFSADGRRLATIDPGGTVSVWDRALAPVGKPLETRAAVYAASFSPDGSRLLTVGRDAAREWDVGRGSSIGTPMHSGERLVEAVFTADAHYVLTISYSGLTKIWDATSTEQISCPERLIGAVYQGAYDRYGIQMLIVRNIGRPLTSGFSSVALTTDQRPASTLRNVAEALAARRVAAAGFLETLAPEDVVDRVRRINQEEKGNEANGLGSAFGTNVEECRTRSTR